MRRAAAGRSRVLQHAALRVLARRHLSRRQPFRPCASARTRGRESRRSIPGSGNADSTGRAEWPACCRASSRSLVGEADPAEPSACRNIDSAATAPLRRRSPTRSLPVAEPRRFSPESVTRALPRAAARSTIARSFARFAQSSALAPLWLRWLTLAPRAIEQVHVEGLPSRAAIISAVVPFGDAASISAPSASR